MAIQKIIRTSRRKVPSERAFPLPDGRLLDEKFKDERGLASQRRFRKVVEIAKVVPALFRHRGNDDSNLAK